MTWLLLALVLDGAPMGRMSVRVSPSVPRGAPVRLEVDANCTSNFSKAMLKTWTVKGVKGTWAFEDPALAPADPMRYRVRFKPEQPLPPGTYQVDGLPSGAQSFEVLEAEDVIAPDGQAVAATCAQRQPALEGCGEDRGAISFEPGTAKDGSATRWVLRLRPKGKDVSLRFETLGIPLGWRTLDKSLTAGAYVATLRVLDAADNEGGTPCEIEVKLPARDCKSLSAARVEAKCASRGPKGEWVSAIDGVTLRLP